MPHIDYYFATISPFTYLSGTRPGDVAKKYGAPITYKPLDIMGLFARTGGTPPKDRHPNRQEYRLQDMIRRAKVIGARMRHLHLTRSSLPKIPAPT